MTELSDYGKLFAAASRAALAKRRMDEALADLEKAEDEWHQACLECDRLEEPQSLVSGESTQGERP